jgi:ADP-heptose:LPS heptosyltransferase
MDLKIKPIQDEVLNYIIGTTTLKKDTEYIANYHWVKHINCKKEQITVPNYNISIDATDKTILVSRAIGLGDILFLTPVLKHIKMKYPTCKIGFATANSQHELLKYISEIDEIIDYPIEYEIYKNYDFHFSVSGVIENSKGNINNIYHEYMKHLGVEDINIKDLIPSITNIDKLDILSDSNIIGIHPFSGDNMRQLSLVSVSFLCNKLINAGFKIILFSNINEYDMYNSAFPQNIEWSIKSQNSFKNTIENLYKCKIVLCSDSIITHLCQAIGVKTISIYGPFSPESRISTYKNIIILDTNPDCRCFKHQLDKCPKGIYPSPCLNFDHDIIIDIIKHDNEFINPEYIIFDPEINKYNWRENE